MKILHTADWHLGKKLEKFSRLDEQRDVADEICVIAEREEIDVVIIAGDVYDAFNPPAEAIELFYKTVKRLSNNGKRAVIVLAGNHDSPERIEAPDPLARECGIIFCGYPHSDVKPFKLETGLAVRKSDQGFLELELPNSEIPMRLISTPYANEIRLRKALSMENSEEDFRRILNDRWQILADKYCDTEGVNILAAHLFVVKKGVKLPEEPEDEKPILYIGGAQPVYTSNIPKQIQYTALGHLHKYNLMETSKGVAVYSGSPLSYSMSEAGQEKGVVVFEIKKNKKPEVKFVSLKCGRALLRKRTESVEEAVAWLKEHQHALVELTVLCDEFLTVDDRKALNEAHAGIITVIPERRHKKLSEDSVSSEIDLSMNMEELFKKYFESKNSLEPADDLMDLFREVLGEVEE